MKLQPKQAKKFLNVYKDLLQFTFFTRSGKTVDSIYDYITARDILFKDLKIIDEYIQFMDKIEEYHFEILENVKNGIKDTFVYLKTLKKHSIFLRCSTNKIYCVLGITDSIDEIVPGKFSVIKTAILNFEKHIICDGLIIHCNAVIGSNTRKYINAQYKKAKENKELIQYITTHSNKQHILTNDFQHLIYGEEIPYGYKLPVVLTKSDHEYILKETFVEPRAFGLGRVKGDKIIFHLSLSEIEYIQGFIAAEANHTKSKRRGEKLDRLFDIFQEYLDKYHY